MYSRSLTALCNNGSNRANCRCSFEEDNMVGSSSTAMTALANPQVLLPSTAIPTTGSVENISQGIPCAAHAMTPISESLGHQAVLLGLSQNGIGSFGSNERCNEISGASKHVRGLTATPAASHRTSNYRGVTRDKWTNRYEAHLWDGSYRREGSARKGREGGYDTERKAAASYDLAALKYWGQAAKTNFHISNYSVQPEEMEQMTKDEYVASLTMY